ncbi:MAG: ATP-binding protein [Elusimicrobiota bacterium]|nr:ATP-binding protein [Elusimicrobiota bacterium]
MTYLRRDLLDEIVKWIDRKEVFAIKGPRQSGKTTLMKMFMEYLQRHKKVKKENIIYLTFEDADILSAFEKRPKEYLKNYLSGKKGRVFFLLDEFQYLKNGGKKLKFLYDTFENVKFVVTGSSSLELASSTGKYMVGRMFSFNLFQFSFKEFLRTKESHLYNAYLENAQRVRDFIEKGKISKPKDDIYKGALGGYFEEYIKFGGYPEVIKTSSAEEKKIILKNIFSTYLTKDIVELLMIRDVSQFRDITAFLASDMGGMINYNHLAQDVKSYFKQIKHFLSVLEETFVIKLIRPYYRNMSTELKKNPKVYFTDTGLRNYIINNFNDLRIRTDAGKLVENFVFRQFSEKESLRIKYWRTLAKAEVDFILDTGNEIIPSEVKYTRKPSANRSFRNFIDVYKPSKSLILTKGVWDAGKIDKTKIMFVPAWYL